MNIMDIIKMAGTTDITAIPVVPRVIIGIVFILAGIICYCHTTSFSEFLFFPRILTFVLCLLFAGLGFLYITSFFWEYLLQIIVGLVFFFYGMHLLSYGLYWIWDTLEERKKKKKLSDGE